MGVHGTSTCDEHDFFQSHTMSVSDIDGIYAKLETVATTPASMRTVYRVRL